MKNIRVFFFHQGKETKQNSKTNKLGRDEKKILLFLVEEIKQVLNFKKKKNSKQKTMKLYIHKQRIFFGGALVPSFVSKRMGSHSIHFWSFPSSLAGATLLSSQGHLE